jgi:hypothetical protein
MPILSLIMTILMTISLAAQDLRGGAVIPATDALAAIRSADGWVGWTIPGDGRTSICCNWKDGQCCSSCSLQENRGFSIGDSDRRPASAFLLMLRVQDGRIEKARIFDAACALDTGGAAVHLVNDVAPAESMRALMSAPWRDEDDVVAAVAMHPADLAVPELERLARSGETEDTREQGLFWLGQRGGERGFRFLSSFLASEEPLDLRKKAVFSISQSEGGDATAVLISLARGAKEREIRKESIFWLGQKAGEKAAGELRRAVDEDEDQDVKEHAVFAISQLPRERAVPLLSELARSHSSPAVREKAIFWLAQTGDERAIDVIEEILK